MKVKFIIPNLITALSLASGLISLNFIAENNFYSASWFIILSIIIDGFDGKLARILKASSDFGALFDTLSDFLVFGIVPAFMIYRSSLDKFYPFGILAALIYVFCGAYRLIRYTVHKDKNVLTTVFLGLPIPAAAGTISITVIINYHLFNTLDKPVFLASLLLFLSFLMVSRIRYSAIEKENFTSVVKYVLIILIIISIILLFIYPIQTLVFWIGFYIIWGLLRHLFRIAHNK